MNNSNNEINNIANPFKEIKRTNWAKKTQDRLIKTQDNKIELKSYVTDEIKEKLNFNTGTKKKTKRVAKSFKVFPGKVVKDFDKRINKLQVHFDDLDFDKNYVDSGKYLMFLMSFAEKYGIYDLYKEIDFETGEFEIDKSKIINHFGKKLG